MTKVTIYKGKLSEILKEMRKEIERETKENKHLVNN